MPLEEEKFDVRVLSTPRTTPHGEDFAPALSRVFGIEPWMAERVAREAPVFVKRGVSLAVAEHLRTTLERLGAKVVIQTEAMSALASPSAATPDDRAPPPMPSLPPARFAHPSAWPPGLPPNSPHAPRPQGPAPLPSEWRQPSPPPRPSARPRSSWGPPGSPGSASPFPGTPRPTAPPTVRAWTPLPPPPPRPAVGTGSILLGAAAAIALTLVGATHWLRSVGDAELLGNTPNEETTCARDYGLTGPGLDESRRTKRTIVVAWRTGCLSDDYRSFLQGLAEAHRGELSIVGAGLAVSGGPAPRSPRSPRSPSSPLSLDKIPLPPPEEWPPRDCEPGFELLPTSVGYVSDSLSPPATYLYDEDGSLIAAWRGGMSPVQRERLTAWLDRRAWW